MYNKQLIDINGYKIMTYSLGASDKVLLLIHGGPGVPCNYLLDTHKFYAEHGYRVVSWDQLGCGESDKPDDTTLWTIGHYIEEVEGVRKALGLNKINILGQSWGGVLGLEYCLKYQQNVFSFIAANTSFNIPLMQRGFERHKLALGHETCRMMATREANGTIEHPEYQAAFNLLAYRHICRAEVWSESLKYSMENIATNVLGAIFGNYLFNCTGSLRKYDKINELYKIQIPVLVLQGEFDYIITECATLAKDNLPNARIAILPGCSHMPFEENPAIYHDSVLNFLVEKL